MREKETEWLCDHTHIEQLYIEDVYVRENTLGYLVFFYWSLIDLIDSSLSHKYEEKKQID